MLQIIVPFVGWWRKRQHRSRAKRLKERESQILRLVGAGGFILPTRRAYRKGWVQNWLLYIRIERRNSNAVSCTCNGRRYGRWILRPRRTSFSGRQPPAALAPRFFWRPRAHVGAGAKIRGVRRRRLSQTSVAAWITSGLHKPASPLSQPRWILIHPAVFLYLKNARQTGMLKMLYVIQGNKWCRLDKLMILCW